MSARRDASPIHPAVHGAVLLGIGVMLAMASTASGPYRALMQEDRAVEWWTTALFATAGVLRLRAAVRARRPFDVLVGIFCLFVAGEEISWGQRLIGFTPPETFLEHNAQQEANVHNFAGVIGKPKWALVAALAGYGLLMPLLARLSWSRQNMMRLGATAPPSSLAPWFGLAIGLLVWYPVVLTGEWVELLAASLFLASADLSATLLAVCAAATLVVALAMTAVSVRGRGSDPVRIACAEAEVQALVRDLTIGQAATVRLLNARSVHKRAWTAAADGYVNWRETRELATASCKAHPSTEVQHRRRYGIDPWGTAYWIRAENLGDTEHRVVVYSFGPNRRRDRGTDDGKTRADDVVAAGVLPAP